MTAKNTRYSYTGKLEALEIFKITDNASTPFRVIEFHGLQINHFDGNLDIKGEQFSINPVVVGQVNVKAYEYSPEYLETYDQPHYIAAEEEIFRARFAPLYHSLLDGGHPDMKQTLKIGEIGYGSARYARYMIKELRNDFPDLKIEYHGTDLSDPYGHVLIEELNGLGASYTCHADTKSLLQERFDWFYAFDVIEHTVDPLSNNGGDIQMIASIDSPFLQATVPVLPPSVPLSRLPEFITNWRHFKPDEHTLYFTYSGFNCLMQTCGWAVTEKDSMLWDKMNENHNRPVQTNMHELIRELGIEPTDKCLHHIYSAVFKKGN